MTSASLQATRLQPQANSIGVDSVLLGVFVGLLMLGLVMVFSSTIALGTQTLQTNTSHLWRQLIHMGLGVTLTVLVATIPVWIWERLSMPLLVLSLLTLVFLLFVGVEVNGSRRWIPLLGFRFSVAAS